MKARCDVGADERYRPLTVRRRILVLLLAIATVVTLWWSLIYRPGGVKRPRTAVPDAALCAQGQSSGCVGGKADVIVVPQRAASANAT